MLKEGKKKLFLLPCCFIMLCVWMMLSSSMVRGETENLSELQEKLAGISEEEKGVLQDLFMLAQEIQEMEGLEAGITHEINILNSDIQELDKRIAKDEARYEDNREVLKQVLKSYQRGGPGSYLEIILKADNLTMLLRRINTLRDLTRNTGTLLEELTENKERLISEKLKQNEKLALVEAKRQELKDAMDKKLARKGEMEKYLAALEEEKEYYQEYLTSIQQMWDTMKPLFPEITKEFAHIIETGSLPEDGLKTSFSLLGIKGSMDEKAFNTVVSTNSRLPEMLFSFRTGQVEMNMPKQNLILTGKFVVLEGHTLKFEVEGGSFYGMPLEAWSIGELFKEGPLMVNLKGLLGKNILKSVEVFEGYLELLIKPVLF